MQHKKFVAYLHHKVCVALMHQKYFVAILHRLYRVSFLQQNKLVADLHHKRKIRKLKAKEVFTMKRLAAIIFLMLLLTSCDNQKGIKQDETVQFIIPTQITDVFDETTSVDVKYANTTAFSFSVGIDTTEETTQNIETTSDTTTSVTAEYVTPDQTTQRKPETVSPAVITKTQTITTAETLSPMTTFTETSPVAETHPPKETQPPSKPKVEETTGPVKTTTVPTPKSPYDMPFDIEAIKNELIVLGESMGMTHRTSYKDGTIITPDNSSWEMPLTASASFCGNALKRSLYDYVSSYAEYELYGGEPITDFTILVESIDGGYLIYFLH